MIFNPNQKGFRRPPDPTKGEMAKDFEQRFQGLMNTIQQLVQILNSNAKGINNLNQQVGVLRSLIEMCDYRSSTTVKMLDERKILTEDEHEKYAEATRIKDFNEMSMKDNIQRGAIPALEGYKAQLGDIVILRLQSYDTITNEILPEISPLRVKFLIGENRMRLVENELIGVVKGETKESVVVLGVEYDKMAGTKIKFKMEIFDVLLLPKRPDAPKVDFKAPTFEEAKKVIESAEPINVIPEKKE